MQCHILVKKSLLSTKVYYKNAPCELTCVFCMFENISYDLVCSLLKKQRSIEENQILNVYIFGSRVYGTATLSKPKSLVPQVTTQDFDLYVIIEDSVQNTAQILDDNIDITLIHRSEFLKNVHQYHVTSFECISLQFHPVLQKQFVLCEKLQVLPPKLAEASAQVKDEVRHYFSRIADHAFGKGRKKITLEQAYYIALKSFFHSIKILVFAIQIAEHGFITDFSAANPYFQEIMQDFTTHFEPTPDPQQVHDYYYKTIRKHFKQLESQLRKHLPRCKANSI